MAAQLGVQESQFTLGGAPAFLLGISYYGALGVPDAFLRRDLDEMQRYGFNGLRVWATWGAFDNDVSAVEADGSPRPRFLGRLEGLVTECRRRGLVLDVTLSRGNGVTGPPRLQSLAAHLRAAETIVGALKPYRNWYLDLGNERNIEDPRFVSFADLRQLRESVRRLDPTRLVTASEAGDIPRDALREYLLTVGVDFIAPHRPRRSGSPEQTEAKSREYLAWMREIGRVVPVHYQEPFRRGFGVWQPLAGDFLTDARGAKQGCAAGWYLHNGDERHRPDGKPRRSFDLREVRLFDQLDEEERQVVKGLRAIFAGE
jgi:hypothetical protein